jgi:DNA (cytosine-5)-methyltransferase 1
MLNKNDLQLLGLLKTQSHYGGCGGDTIGVENAGGYEVVAMLNHNPVAVATHELNYPNTQHFCADVRKINEDDLPKVDMIWASPSCTHHSIARGGESCDEQERALPEELPRFGLASDANCLMIENVKEFRQWGPVEPKKDKHGHRVYKKGNDGKPEPVFVPVKSRKGEYYLRWVQTLKAMGYVNYEWKLLNAADFGVPQSRLRYFGIFTRKGINIVWPKPTHDQHGRNGLPKWTAVRGCLDLADRGHSIFTREERGAKALKDKSLRRILAGVRKHVIATGVAKPFFNKYLSNSANGKPNPGPGIDEPGHTITCQQRLALVQPQGFMFNPAWFGGSRSLENPSPVAVASQDKVPLMLVQAQSFISSQYGRYQNTSMGNVCPAVLANPKQHLVSAQLLFSNYGSRRTSEASRTFTLDNVARTLTGTAGNQYLMTYYRHGAVKSLDDVCPTVTTKDRAALVGTEGFLFSQQFSNTPRALSEPARTIVASRRHQYVVQVQRGCPHLMPKPSDSVTMRLVKAVCRKFGIADIFMRMLKVPELKRIMGFPENYRLLGNTTEQKAMLGNAVCPPVAEALARAMRPNLEKARLMLRPKLKLAPVQRWEQGVLFADKVPQ